MAILKLKQADGSFAEIPALIGKNGKTPYIKDDYWWIGETNTNVKAEGTDGKTPYIKESYWWIDNTNTNVKAEGVDGTDGKTAYAYAQEGGYGGTEAQFTEKLANGFGGLHIGSSTPPETADVWVDPNGEPTMVEEWEFDMDDGTVETKSVVVTESEDATNGKKAAILRVRQADGTFAEIPALKGKTAYEYAQEGGFTGTEEEFMALLLGDREYDASAITSGVFPLSRGGTGAATVEGVLLNLGLENVNNTSDAEKPISTATQEALDAKANKDEVPTKTSQLTNDSDFATNASVDSKVAAIVESAPETLNTLNELAAALGDDPNFATTVANEIGKKADADDIPKALSELTADSTHRTVTDAEKTTWNAKSNFSGNYNDLTNKPAIPTVPSSLPANGGNADTVDNKHASDFATAEQGTKADNALPKSGGTLTGTLYGNSGIELTANASSANNDQGVTLKNSGYTARMSIGSSGGLGIYSDSALFIRPAYSEGTGYGVKMTKTDMSPTTNASLSLGTSSSMQYNNIYGKTIYQNGKQVANKEDVPSTTEIWTFTLEDGTKVTKAVYVK